MRRTLLALGALGTSIAPAVLVSGAAYAQSTTTPTTVESSVVNDTAKVPVNSSVTVTSQRTVTTAKEVDTNATDDDDDSDKTGLWGLLGLLGLLGLAGLAGRKRHDDVTTRSAVSADTTPRGSTSGSSDH